MLAVFVLLLQREPQLLPVLLLPLEPQLLPVLRLLPLEPQLRQQPLHGLRCPPSSRRLCDVGGATKYWPWRGLFSGPRDACPCIWPSPSSARASPHQMVGTIAEGAALYTQGQERVLGAVQAAPEEPVSQWPRHRPLPLLHPLVEDRLARTDVGRGPTRTRIAKPDHAPTCPSMPC